MILLSFLLGMFLELHTVVTGDVHSWGIQWPVQVSQRCPPMLIERHQCQPLKCTEHDACVIVDHAVICTPGHACKEQP